MNIKEYFYPARMRYLIIDRNFTIIETFKYYNGARKFIRDNVMMEYTLIPILPSEVFEGKKFIKGEKYIFLNSAMETQKNEKYIKGKGLRLK